MIKIYGYSDDTVYVERESIEPASYDAEDFGCFDKPVVLRIGTDKSGMFVTMRYGAHKHSGGTWSTELEMIEEGVPVPWGIFWKVEEGKYTGLLSINCPADTPVVRIGEGSE